MIDLKGKKFGRLTALRVVARDGARVWECLCVCGNKTALEGAKLRSGNTKSCGCLRKEVTAARNSVFKRIHGHTAGDKESPTFESWSSMHSRCNNPKATGYEKYGGRGIRICARWGFFANFLADMGERPKGTTLGRKDNDGHYTKDNCRWETDIEQANNMSSNVLIEHAGEKLTITQWARKADIPMTRLWGRINRGWPIEKALYTPPFATRRKTA